MRIGLLALLLALPSAAPLHGQVRWTVDPALSLAWWQVNPHLNHLWATTCPGDPSWRPGEDRGSGWLVPTGEVRRRDDAVADTIVPLLPRKLALPLCARAVRGEVVTGDPATWQDTRGLVIVTSDSLVTGLEMRDTYARKAVYETARYPDIRFAIDSLTAVQPGDTVHATIRGMFEFRGVRQPVTAQAKAWREAGGMRVTARFDLVPADLASVYGITRVTLGLGVGGLVWKTVHLGVDLVLKQKG